MQVLLEVLNKFELFLILRDLFDFTWFIWFYVIYLILRDLFDFTWFIWFYVIYLILRDLSEFITIYLNFPDFIMILFEFLELKSIFRFILFYF